MENSFVYVIFGASGDLTKRKLVPAIYSLYVHNLLPENFAILGVSRTGFSDEVFRLNMEKALEQFNETDNHGRIGEFIGKLFYSSLHPDAIRNEILKVFQSLRPIKKEEVGEVSLHGYPAGTWGPEKADELIDDPDMTWRYTCKNLAHDGTYCEL